MSALSARTGCLPQGLIHPKHCFRNRRILFQTMASSGSSHMTQMTFGDAGATAMPAAGSCPSTGNDERTDSSGGGAQEGSCTWYSQPPSPAPTETKSPRIDISPRAKPSTALHCGGDSAVPQSVIDISPVRPARLPSQHEPDGGLPKPSVVPPIVGLSSAGAPTSGLMPVPAHLGTPREARSRSPTQYEELEDRVPPSPQWPDQDVVVSHRGKGTIRQLKKHCLPGYLRSLPSWG